MAADSTDEWNNSNSLIVTAVVSGRKTGVHPPLSAAGRPPPTAAAVVPLHGTIGGSQMVRRPAGTTETIVALAEMACAGNERSVRVASMTPRPVAAAAGPPPQGDLPQQLLPKQEVAGLCTLLQLRADSVQCSSHIVSC